MYVFGEEITDGLLVTILGILQDIAVPFKDCKVVALHQGQHFFAVGTLRLQHFLLVLEGDDADGTRFQQMSRTLQGFQLKALHIYTKSVAKKRKTVLNKKRKLIV